MPQAQRFSVAAEGNIALGKFENTRPGDLIKVWAAGATADTINADIGGTNFYSGQINIEGSADVVDREGRDYLGSMVAAAEDTLTIAVTGTVTGTHVVVERTRMGQQQQIAV